MRLKIKTISPLHIGSGSALEPFEYIIDNNIFFRLNSKKAFELAYEQHADFPEKYQHWLDENSQKLQSDDNRLQAKIRSTFNFRSFCERELNDKALVKDILQYAYLYKCPVPYSLQGKKQILEMLRQSDYREYIPGSSIKGVIRTALMWKVFNCLSSAEKAKHLSGVLNSRKLAEGKGKDLDELLEQSFFICGERDRKTGKTDYSNIQMDIMKFIRITDSQPVKSETAVLPVNLYLTDKEPQPSTPALEVIAPGSEFLFEIKINEAELRKIDILSMKPETGIWIGFQDKFSKLFGFRISEVAAGALEERISIEIRNTLKAFSAEVFVKEGNWVSNFRRTVDAGKQVHNNASIQEIKKFYEELPIEKALIRIGWGSGYAGTTIYSAIIKDEALSRSFKEIIDKFRIGYPRGMKNKEVSSPNLKKFPKSKRMAAQELNLPVSPLGWAVILGENEDIQVNMKLESYIQMPSVSPVERKPDISADPGEMEKLVSDIALRNSGRKYKDNDAVEAVYVRHTGDQVVVKLLDNRYDKNEFVLKYPASEIIAGTKYLRVNVNVTNGTITGIKRLFRLKLQG